MASWIFSVFLYIGTVVAGLYIDTCSGTKYKTIRRLYLIWLYIFLCFGYMVGSDWRSYESIYKTGVGVDRFLTEPGSYFAFTVIPSFIPDYWLFAGIAKCFYLYSTKHLISNITTKWISVLSILIPTQLGFMLIQNPFRFMLASIFMNYALSYLFLYLTNQKYNSIKYILIVIAFTVIAVLFHNSCLFLLFVLPLLIYSNKIHKVNSWIIFLVYIFLTFVTSNPELIQKTKIVFFVFLQKYADISDYTAYEIEEVESFFSIGTITRVLFFIFILLSKNTIIKKHKYGDVVFSLAIVYFFILRLFTLVPTGFRLALPFTVFCVIFYVFMLSSKKYFAYIIITYTLLSFGKTLWTKYEFIPYSNSIPYIVLGHKEYQERFNYNLNEYKERTGETYYLDRDYGL